MNELQKYLELQMDEASVALWGAGRTTAKHNSMHRRVRVPDSAWSSGIESMSTHSNCLVTLHEGCVHRVQLQ